MQRYKWNEMCCECETETKTQIKAGCGCLVYICDGCSRKEVRHKKCARCSGKITPAEDRRIAEEYEDMQYEPLYEPDWMYKYSSADNQSQSEETYTDNNYNPSDYDPC